MDSLLIAWLVSGRAHGRGFERTMGRISDIVKWTQDSEDAA